MTPADVQHTRTVALNALAAICASERGDLQSVAHLIASVVPDDLAEFTVACIGIAGNLLRQAADGSGTASDQVARAVYESIGDTDAVTETE